jgi:hypothetical protein
MTSESMVEYPSVTLASKVLDCVDNLQNTEITNPSVNEIIALINALANHCNTKFLREFPLSVNVVSKQSIALPTEIKSWYHHDLTLTNIREIIVSTFRVRERFGS